MNNKKEFFKEYIKPILSLTLICLVVTAAVSGTYQLTKPVIEQSQNSAADEARKVVLPSAESFEKLEIEETILQELGVVEAHISNDKGIAVKIESKGYSPSKNITLMVGIDSNGTVSGVSVLDHSETDGLGTKALASDYLEKFSGKSQNVNDVDGVSGATFSSLGVKNGINNALKLFDVINGAEMPKEPEPEEIRKEVLPTAESFEKIEIDESTLKELGVIEAHVSNDGGIAVKIESKGYSPSKNITLMVGIDSNGAISGISILDHSETEGLGTKAFSSEYLTKMYGKTQNVDEIEAISGATFSSTGVKNGINNAFKLFEIVKGGAVA